MITEEWSIWVSSSISSFYYVSVLFWILLIFSHRNIYPRTWKQRGRRVNISDFKTLNENVSALINRSNATGCLLAQLTTAIMFVLHFWLSEEDIYTPERESLRQNVSPLVSFHVSRFAFRISHFAFVLSPYHLLVQSFVYAHLLSARNKFHFLPE